MDGIRPIDNRASDRNFAADNEFVQTVGPKKRMSNSTDTGLKSRKADPEVNNDPNAPIPPEYLQDDYIGPTPPRPPSDGKPVNNDPNAPLSEDDHIELHDGDRDEAIGPPKPAPPAPPVPFTADQYKKFVEEQKDGMKKFIEGLMKNPYGSVAYEYGVYLKLTLAANSPEYKDKIDLDKLKKEFDIFLELNKEEITKLQNEQLGKYTESAFGMTPEEVAAKTKEYMESPEFAKSLLALSPEERQKVMEELMAVMTAVDPIGGAEAIEKLMNNMVGMNPADVAAGMSKDELAKNLEDAINKLMIVARLGLSVAGAFGQSFEKLTDAQLENIRKTLSPEFAALLAAEAKGEQVTPAQWKEVTDKIEGFGTEAERTAAKNMVDFFRTPKGQAGLFGMTVVVTVGILGGNGIDMTKPNEVMDLVGWMCWIATGSAAMVDLGFDLGKIQALVDKMPSNPIVLGRQEGLTFGQMLQNVLKAGAVSTSGAMPSFLKGMGVLNPVGSFLFLASAIYLAPQQLKDGNKLGAGLGLTGGGLFGIGGAAEVYGLLAAYRAISAPLAAIPIIGQIAYIAGIVVFLVMSIVNPGEMSIEDLAKAGIIPPTVDDDTSRTDFWIAPNDKEEPMNGS